MADIVYINNQDIDELGLRVLDAGDWWSGLTYERGYASPYGMAGGLPATEARVQPRRLVLGLALEGAVATRVGLLDDVRHYLRGLLEVRFGDGTTRVAYGLLESDQVTGRWGGPSTWVVGDLALRLSIVFFDAAKYDRYGSVIGLTTTRSEIPLGTAACGGKVLIYAATNPVIQYRAFGGAVTKSMTFTVTLAATEALEVDLNAQTVTKISSGVRTDALSTWTAGSWFRLDPADGDGDNDVWPTLETTVGTGEFLYCRRWAS